MPVPKRKTSKARRDQRSSCKFIRPVMAGSCTNCEHPVVSHAVCEMCGFYKGRKVMAGRLDRAVLKKQKREAAAIAAAQAREAADQQAQGKEGK